MLCNFCRDKDDEHGSGGKIVASMPPSGQNGHTIHNDGTNGTNGTNGSSETVGLISGRKSSR